MEIKSLKIMLPYLNDEYVVGKNISHCNQASCGETKKESTELGIITTIEYCENSIYLIRFESGECRKFVDTPVQVTFKEQ